MTLHQPPDALLETCQQVVGRNRLLFGAAIDRDDLVQEAAIAAIKASPRFDATKSRPATFTWTAARRRLIDLFRSRKNHRIHENISSQLESGPICSDELNERIDRALTAAESLLGGRMGERRSFPLYRLCACLIVAAGLRQSSRSFHMMLCGSPAMCQRLGLRRAPSRATLFYAAAAIRRHLRRARLDSRSL